jgi:hypothetical protein
MKFVGDFKMCEVLGFHGGEDSSRGLLGCDTMYCCDRIPTFRMIFLQEAEDLNFKTCSRFWLQLTQIFSIM